MCGCYETTNNRTKVYAIGNIFGCMRMGTRKMDDLVKMLRRYYAQNREVWDVCEPAANRIEKLESALREIGHINNKRDRFSSQIDEILCNTFWTEKDGTKIEKGWLSNRAYNALMSDGINTIEKIEEAGARHLLRLPNLGLRTLKEIKEFLACRGISLLEYGKNKWE